MTHPPLGPSRHRALGGNPHAVLSKAPPAPTFFDLWLALEGPLFYRKGTFAAAEAIALATHGDPTHNWSHDPGDPTLAVEVALALLETNP